MKTKMSLSAEMDLIQDSVVQLTCWCGQIALHELWGLGCTRLDRITRRKELLGSQSLAVVMQPDKNGMPQTEKARHALNTLIYYEEQRIRWTDTSTVSVTFHNTFIKKEGEGPSLGS